MYFRPFKHMNPIKLYRDIQEYGLGPALGMARKFHTNKVDTLAQDMLEYAGAVALPEDATSFRIPRASSEEGDLMVEFSGAFTLPSEVSKSFIQVRNKM